MQKIAALSSFLGAAILVATTITDLINEFEKLKLKNAQKTPTLLPSNRVQPIQENTIKLVDHRTNDRNYPRKSGYCRICEFKGYTEWHHIISQHHARKTNQHPLLRNPGNVVELCKSCHNQTTASKSRYLHEKKNKNGKKTNKFW